MSKPRHLRLGFKDESQLVERAAEWMRADGWTCYFEVAPWGSGAARADIVATRGPMLAVVECKLSLSLALLEQCSLWTRFAHVVWGCTPTGKRSEFAQTVASHIGCGLVQIGSFDYPDSRIRLQPDFRRRVKDQEIRKHLNEQQQMTAPGAAHSYSTPFTQTCDRLRGLVREAGGRIAVKDAMTKLRHHYINASSARTSLISRAEAGVINGLRVARDGKLVFFEEATP